MNLMAGLNAQVFAMTMFGQYLGRVYCRDFQFG